MRKDWLSGFIPPGHDCLIKFESIPEPAGFGFDRMRLRDLLSCLGAGNLYGSRQQYACFHLHEGRWAAQRHSGEGRNLKAPFETSNISSLEGRKTSGAAAYACLRADLVEADSLPSTPDLVCVLVTPPQCTVACVALMAELRVGDRTTSCAPHDPIKAKHCSMRPRGTSGSERVLRL